MTTIQVLTEKMTTGVLAAATRVSTLPSNFHGDPADIEGILNRSGAVFSVVQRVFIFIGIVIVIWTAKNVIFALIGAKPTEALKKFLGGLTAAILCFNLLLPLTLVTSLGRLFGEVFNAISRIIG